MSKIKDKKISKIAAKYGSQGGRATVKRYGKSYMSKIGAKGAEARWGKKKRLKDKNNK